MGRGPNIPECRGYAQDCGEYVENSGDLCEYCETERHLDEQLEAWQQMRDEWQLRQAGDTGRWGL